MDTALICAGQIFKLLYNITPFSAETDFSRQILSLKSIPQLFLMTIAHNIGIQMKL